MQAVLMARYSRNSSKCSTHSQTSTASTCHSLPQLTPPAASAKVLLEDSPKRVAAPLAALEGPWQLAKSASATTLLAAESKCSKVRLRGVGDLSPADKRRSPTELDGRTSHTSPPAGGALQVARRGSGRANKADSFSMGSLAPSRSCPQLSDCPGSRVPSTPSSQDSRGGRLSTSRCLSRSGRLPPSSRLSASGRLTPSGGRSPNAALPPLRRASEPWCDAPLRPMEHMRPDPWARDPWAECYGWASRTTSDFVVPPKRRPAPLSQMVLESPSGGSTSRLGSAAGKNMASAVERACMADTSRLSPTSTTTEVPEDVEVPLGPALLEIFSGYQEEHAGVPERFVRLVFKRFTRRATNEVPLERLHDALVHLGFLTSTPERALELAGQLSTFDALDLADFGEFVGKFASMERASLRRSAHEAAQLRGSMTCEGVLKRFLRTAGVLLPGSSIAKAQRAASLNLEATDMSVDDILLGLASCRVDEGFTKEEVATAYEVFSELEQEQHSSPRGWGARIEARMLVDGLLSISGVYCVDHTAELMKTLSFDFGKERGVCFHEFLVWARRLRDAMARELYDAFVELDVSGTGVVDLEGAISILSKSGITLLEDATQELAQEMGLQRSDQLDFDAVMRLAEACRRCHGFSQDELAEYSAAFSKFDCDSSGELTNMQVLDMLRYLGNSISVDEARAMIKRVDFNGNGTMDREEFLKLMRLVRENDIECVRARFSELCGPAGRLPAAKVQEALAALHLFPQQDELKQLLRERPMPALLDFGDFMRLAGRCRFFTSLELRKRAGFNDDVVLELAQIWRQGGPKRTFATVGEVVWMLSDSQLRVNTSHGRRMLLQRVQAARDAAIAAGVPEHQVVREGTTDVGFSTFLHLVRGIIRDSEQEVITREKEALALTRFTSAEATEFRGIFEAAVAAEEGKKAPSSFEQLMIRKSRGVGEVLAQLMAVQGMPEQGVVQLLRSIGLTMPSAKLKELTLFLNTVRTPAETDRIHFATFLRLMRWMMDTNFADIRSVMDIHKGIRVPESPSDAAHTLS